MTGDLEATWDDQRTVLEAYGIAMAAAHTLDLILLGAVVGFRLANGSLTAEATPKFLEDHSKATLGALATELRKVATLSEKTDAVLRAVIEDRNALAHYFFREYVRMMRTREGCRKLVATLMEKATATATFGRALDLETRRLLNVSATPEQLAVLHAAARAVPALEKAFDAVHLGEAVRADILAALAKAQAGA